MPKYPQGMPKHCPSKQAKPRDGLIYRGIKKSVISDKDFLSHGERPKSKCDRSTCEAWGLSIWLEMADVNFARTASSFIRNNLFIAAGHIGAEDGCVLHTPSNDQPQHHTFWKYTDANIHQRFTIVLDPVSVEL